MYAEAGATFKALGATVSFDKARRAYTVTLPRPAAIIPAARSTPLQDVAGATQLAGSNGKPGQIFGLGQAFG